MLISMEEISKNVVILVRYNIFFSIFYLNLDSNIDYSKL